MYRPALGTCSVDAKDGSLSLGIGVVAVSVTFRSYKPIASQAVSQAATLERSLTKQKRSFLPQQRPNTASQRGRAAINSCCERRDLPPTTAKTSSTKKTHARPALSLILFCPRSTVSHPRELHAFAPQQEHHVHTMNVKENN